MRCWGKLLVLVRLRGEGEPQRKPGEPLAANLAHG